LHAPSTTSPGTHDAHTLNGIDNVGGCNSVWSRFSRILNYITYERAIRRFRGVEPRELCTGCMHVQLFNPSIRKRICYTSMHTRFHGIPALFPITQAGCVIVYLAKAALRQLYGYAVRGVAIR
jgi:hypothetical protein